MNSNMIQQLESINRPLQRVVAAAIRNSHGDVIIGARHYDTWMRKQITSSTKEWGDYKTITQGFINQYGNFLTREEAWTIAVSNGQIIRQVGGNDANRLYSENLY